ncbi:MAG: amidohydrolase family protein [Terracidiphilus sp.]|nr:amidohydrolase family protein [Terracidiphilus sp.]
MLNRRRFVARSAAALAALPVQPLLAGIPASPLMIDSHVHVFERNPRFPFAAGAHVPAEDAPPERLLQLMAANGIARTVIIQVIHYRWDNSYLLDVLRRYPGKFHGVCRVNPEDPAAPDHLSQHTRDGFRGVRISPDATAGGDWIRSPLMKPLWRRCNDLRVPMTILAPITRIPDLVPLIEANPELTVVIDHMADCPLDRPDQLKFLLALARYPRVYVKISDLWSLSQQPYPYPDAQQQVRRIYDAFGPRRLMWATNWPVSLKQLPYAKIVELYRDHIGFFNAEDRREIFAGTAQRIWPFGL